MYRITTNIELPIAHCLYRGAYSGLCCGNVYRDLKNDGEKDRYELGNKVLPVLHGHNYVVTISLSSEELDKNGMIVDFKKMKKIIHSYFDQFDHSMILTPDNPLVEVYKKNFKENGIDFERSRVFVWSENPTAEYMSKYWFEKVKESFTNEGLKLTHLAITVEETSKNSVTYEEDVK